MALRLQLSASLWCRRLLVDSFGHWQKARELRLAQLRAAQRLARLVLRHAQRRNLQTWRQQAEEGRLTYLEARLEPSRAVKELGADRLLRVLHGQEE